MSIQNPQPDATPLRTEIADLQREVQRLLGRCMLRLQQYEQLLKALVARHEIAGPAHSIEQTRDERVQDAATKTLGFLIGRLLETYVVVSSAEREITSADAPAATISFGFRASIEMSADDHARTRDGLKDLVEMRNELVHHFVEHFDLWQAAGCAAARDHLLSCYERIGSHYEQLRSWFEQSEQSRQLAASLMQSPVLHEFVVNGITPHGVVHWAAAGSVTVLLEASRQLAVGGWTPLDAAVQWICAQHPDQTPEKYQCRSWPQVLFESGRFELRYRDDGGRKQPWYRERPPRKKT